MLNFHLLEKGQGIVSPPHFNINNRNYAIKQLLLSKLLPQKYIATKQMFFFEWHINHERVTSR